MSDKFYKYKNVKHSVILRFIRVERDTGRYFFENKYYKGLYYTAEPEEVEEVKDETIK